MTYEGHPRKSTTLIDSESAAEMARLMNQHRIVTLGMGGLFPDDLDLSNILHVLDLGCGPGSWALDVAFEHSNMDVIGIDASRSMVAYARAQGQAQRLQNVRFKNMDLLMPLACRSELFDLIDGRFLSAKIPAAVWPVLLSEGVRMLRPGGIVHLIDGERYITTSSVCEHMLELITLAMKKAGYGFSPDGRHVAVATRLQRLLRQAGCEQIQERAYAINFSAGTKAYESMLENVVVMFQLCKPFLVQMGVVSGEEFDQLYRECSIALMQEDFCGIWFFLATWGMKPDNDSEQASDLQLELGIEPEDGGEGDAS